MTSPVNLLQLLSGNEAVAGMDEYWMRAALDMAIRASQIDEVPVGAIVVSDGKQIGAGFNQPISTKDATAHAEIMALRDAAGNVGNYRLPESTLYVTLEPCMMCAGALIHARVKRLVYGAHEPKAGVVISHPLLQSDWLNHAIGVSGGVLSERCGVLLTDFFASRRAH